MRLTEIQLEGFGRLIDRSFGFAPGLNLIYGPNEAGKSTLQQAMLALLYGFFGRGSVSAAKRRSMAAFQPWDEAPYAGSLTFVLDNGEAYQVSRRFDGKPSVHLTTHPDGRDLSAHYDSGSHGRLYFADEQLGLSKEVFEHVCIVRQAELVALERSAGAITDSLMRLLASADTDTTVTEATALIDAALKDQVGTDRSWTRPLPKANARLQELSEERTRLLEARRECFAQVVALHGAEQRLHELELGRQRLQYLETAADREARRRQLDNANEAAKETARLNKEVARWRAWAGFPAHLRDDVLRLSAQRDRLLQDASAKREQAAAAQKKVSSLEERAKALESELAGLEGARATLAGEMPRVEEMAHDWRLACEGAQAASHRLEDAGGSLEQAEARLAQERAGLGAALELGQAGLAQLSQQLRAAEGRVAQSMEAMKRAETEWARTGMSEPAFQELERTVQAIQAGLQAAPKPRRGCRGLVSRSPVPDQPATELVIYSQLKPLHQQLTGADDERAASQSALHALEDQVRTSLGALVESPTPSAIDVLARRLERQQTVAAEVEQQTRAVAQCQSELTGANCKRETAEEALRSALADLGHDREGVQASLAAFQESCSRRERLDRVEADYEHNKAQLQACRDDVKTWEQHQEALEAIETELLRLVGEAKLPEGKQSLEDALEAFEQGVNRHANWSKAQAELEAAIKREQELCSDRSELETALRDVEERLAALCAEHPEWQALEPSKSAREYVAERDEAESSLASARDEVTRLREAVQAPSALKHPAELDEEIAAVRARIGRLERFREALQVAHRELAQASHDFQSQFAPRLEALLGEGLADVTRGRYSEASVDPDTLAVSVTAPELGEAVAVDHLSTGTRDLIYLLLRLSIARLMSSSEETLPLLLDDPLVQCDENRRKCALDYLSQLAEDSQILFFTKDEATRSWFEGSLAGSDRHRLHLLA